MTSCKSSRRRFLSRAAKALMAGIAFRSLKAETAPDVRRSPQVSWREARHFARKRKLAG